MPFKSLKTWKLHSTKEHSVKWKHNEEILEKIRNDTSNKYHCSVCALTFKTFQEWRNHCKETHDGFKCPYCPFNFKKYKNLKMHNKGVHKGEERDLFRKNEEISKNQFKCTPCDLYFDTRDSWRNHKKNHKVRGKDDLFDEISTQFKCKTCDLYFETQVSWKKHKTDSCELSFKVQGIPMTEKYKCIVCGLKFKTFPGWRRHCKESHEGYRLLFFRVVV